MLDRNCDRADNPQQAVGYRVLEREIESAEKAIDQVTYSLYNLTEADIAIVEGG